jgi:Rod binding domain-containing protein
MAASFDMKSAGNVRSAYQAIDAQKLSGVTRSLTGTGTGVNAKAWQASQDFEAVFLNSMFSQMFTGIDGDGPFGGGQALGIWRSFLTDEYSKSFAKNGGIGIASDVYRTLMAQQEARSDAVAAATETRP